MEELALGLVGAFVGVGTEALRGVGSHEMTFAERKRPAGVSEWRQRANQLALGLHEIRGETRGAVAVVVVEAGTEDGGWDAVEGGDSHLPLR